MAGASTFIENVNTVANATKLATGDIIEDAQLARDEAVAAADEASEYANDALASERKAYDWAQKEYNNEVEPGMFSAYHWSEKARLQIGDPVINDLVISKNYTWSSQQISDKLVLKSNTDHNHLGVYEPYINPKNTAFNKAFGGSGVSQDVSRADHNHDTVYEPIIQNKGTAFNKDFGSASGTVAEGNHTHNYEPAFTHNTAFNRNFVVDPDNPLVDEVPRGTHVHKAQNVVYDPTNNSIITSTTVQGAIGQLDGQLGTFDTFERTNLTAGMSNESDIIPITAVSTPVKISTAMTVSVGSRNALYTNGAIKINYSEAPTKKIEGWFAFTVTIQREANTKYKIHMYVNDTLIDSSFNVDIGTDTSSEGINQVSLDGFITNLENGDELSIYVSNETNDNDITITGVTTSFAGSPEGALVVSGLAVDHSELTGTGAPNGVHTISDIQDLTATLDSKADKVVGAAENNITVFDNTGNIKDSGIAYTAIDGKMDKVSNPSSGRMLMVDGNGNAVESSYSDGQLANKYGDGVTFRVADPQYDTHAVTKQYMENVLGNYATQQSLDTHESASNPHSITPSLIGAAEEVHTHVIQDTTGLQDSLDDKYDKVANAATNNVVIFETGGLLKDSGKTLDDIVGTPDETGFSFHELSTEGVKGDAKWNPFRMSPKEINADQVIPTGSNATIGDFTLGDGFTITVEDNASLIVV